MELLPHECTPYPALRLKLTSPQSLKISLQLQAGLKLQVLPGLVGPIGPNRLHRPDRASRACRSACWRRRQGRRRYCWRRLEHRQQRRHQWQGRAGHGSGFQGRTTAGLGNVEDLTPTQATALLNPFTTTVKGLVSANGSLDATKFLTTDNTWAVPPGTGQPLDTDLTALANLTTTGIVVRTGAGTATTRQIAPPATGITISNANGVGGDPTLALANDLAQIEALAGQGIAVRTGQTLGLSVRSPALRE